MRSLRQFHIFLFTKRFHAHKKHKTNISKQKQKRQHFYAHKKHLRGKSRLFTYLRFCAFCAFYTFCAFCALKIFSRKKIIKKFKTALMTSFTLSLMVIFIFAGQQLILGFLMIFHTWLFIFLKDFQRTNLIPTSHPPHPPFVYQTSLFLISNKFSEFLSLALNHSTGLTYFSCEIKFRIRCYMIRQIQILNRTNIYHTSCLFQSYRWLFFNFQMFFHSALLPNACSSPLL